MQKTLPNGKWRKRLKIKALPPFAELHKVGAGNCKMFLENANTVRRYIKDNDIGITLTRGRRVNAARWKEFLGETLEETELPAGATPVDRSPNRYADLLSFYAV